MFSCYEQILFILFYFEKTIYIIPYFFRP